MTTPPLMLTALSYCLWFWPWVDLMLGGNTWPSSSPYCRTSFPSFTPPRHASRDRFVDASMTSSLELDFLESGSGMQHFSCCAGDITAQTRSSWGHSHAPGQRHRRKGAATSRHQWHHPLHWEERLDQAGHFRHVSGLHRQGPHCAAQGKGHHYSWHSWHGCRQRSHYSHPTHDLQLKVQYSKADRSIYGSKMKRIFKPQKSFIQLKTNSLYVRMSCLFVYFFRAKIIQFLWFTEDKIKCNLL